MSLFNSLDDHSVSSEQNCFMERQQRENTGSVFSRLGEVTMSMHFADC